MNTYYPRCSLAIGEGIVSLSVTLSRCVCVRRAACHVYTARRISLGGEGNALYPVLSSSICISSCCLSYYCNSFVTQELKRRMNRSVDTDKCKDGLMLMSGISDRQICSDKMSALSAGYSRRRPGKSAHPSFYLSRRTTTDDATYVTIEDSFSRVWHIPALPSLSLLFSSLSLIATDKLPSPSIYQSETIRRRRRGALDFFSRFALGFHSSLRPLPCFTSAGERVATYR